MSKLSMKDGSLYYGNGVYIGKVYVEVDGYWVWVAPNPSTGCWSSGELKMIAEFLDELNEPWDKEVREFFENS